ncbi:MAG: hypothetical protein QOJ61_2612 [Mycobacterium sp.]|jgi:hypothetical protein|nr:hypothetical protein [Mycobacterium sp.]
MQATSEDFIDHLAAIGNEGDVRRGVQRYVEAGTTNPVLAGILATDYDATLRAVAADIAAPSTS